MHQAEFIVDATTAPTLTMKTRHTYGWLRRTLSVQSSSLRVVPTLVVVRCTMIGTARGTLPVLEILRKRCIECDSHVALLAVPLSLLSKAKSAPDAGAPSTPPIKIRTGHQFAAAAGPP